jgi:hypothetical protein
MDNTSETDSISSDGECHIFKLPPELINAIYEIRVPDVGPVCVRPEGDGAVVASHSLSLVCKKFRSEFHGVLANTSPKAATTIFAKVRDLNFVPLLTFLERIPASERGAAFNIRGAPGGRMLIIDLSFTAGYDSKKAKKFLAQWFKWVKTQRKKGANLYEHGIKYNVEAVEDRDKVTTSLDLEWQPDADIWWEPMRLAIDLFLRYGVSDEIEARRAKQRMEEAAREREMVRHAHRMGATHYFDPPALPAVPEQQIGMQIDGQTGQPAAQQSYMGGLPIAPAYGDDLNENEVKQEVDESATEQFDVRGLYDRRMEAELDQNDGDEQDEAESDVEQAAEREQVDEDPTRGGAYGRSDCAPQ